MDLLTLGGIAAAVVIVLAACFVMFKLLSRETTFEEAYGDSAIKLLTNQPSAEKSNKKEKHKHKPKRKQSPKDARPNKQMDEEVIMEHANLLQMPSVEEEGKNVVKESEVNKTEENGSAKQKGQRGKNEKHKQKLKSKSPSVKAETSAEVEVLEEGEKAIVDGKSAAKEQTDTVGDAATAAIETPEMTVEKSEERTEAAQQQQHPVKKSNKRNVSLKDLSMPRVVERLKEIGELETEYVGYLQYLAEEVKAKENKLRIEIKEVKAEKTEAEKKLKNAANELEILRVETDKIMKEKKEQNERHVIFEQTVRQKLVETVQLKDENKKLTELLGQANSKLGQVDQHFSQKIGLINLELTKARGESVKHQNYADAVATEAEKTKQQAEESLRNAQVNFERNLKTLQTELNVSKSVNDDRLQALQNELNREKDHHMKVMLSAQTQVGDLTRELEKALVAYGNLAQQQSDDNTKCGELSSRIRQMDEEISQLTKEAKNSSEADEQKKISVAELTKCLEEQKEKNKELQNDKSKLMDSIKEMQSSQHSQLNGGGQKSENAAEPTDTILRADKEQLDRLTAENQNYKRTLDSLNDQLEKVSRIAQELEREKGDSQIGG